MRRRINSIFVSRESYGSLKAMNSRELAVFHMIYTSKESIAFGPSDLKKLLVNARLRNNAVSVTGILHYRGGVFLQALEGTEAEVRKVFNRIEKDPRHNKIEILDCATTSGQRRKFGDWSMAFADETGSAHLLRGFVDARNFPGLLDLDQNQAAANLKIGS